ncbi:hypothetical protein DFH06DRAFT_1310119 [Mycena polygramma]|nr:hypothetical protein DFH06DRAFT_1310119 [Mycena polygramma]
MCANDAGVPSPSSPRLRFSTAFETVGTVISPGSRGVRTRRIYRRYGLAGGHRTATFFRAPKAEQTFVFLQQNLEEKNRNPRCQLPIVIGAMLSDSEHKESQTSVGLESLEMECWSGRRRGIHGGDNTRQANYVSITTKANGGRVRSPRKNIKSEAFEVVQRSSHNYSRNGAQTKAADKSETSLTAFGSRMGYRNSAGDQEGKKETYSNSGYKRVPNRTWRKLVRLEAELEEEDVSPFTLEAWRYTG